MEFLIPIPVSFVLALLWASWRSHRARHRSPEVSAEDYRRALAALAPRQPRSAGGGQLTRRGH